MSYCEWDGTKEQKKYHDETWGRPIHDDFQHFEFLSFEVLQCGLSWWLVYGKRDLLKKCFADFDFQKVAEFTEKDINLILNTPGMIKSEKKIRAIIHNAKMFKKIVDSFGSFDKYLWRFSNYKTIIYDKHSDGFVPASNGLSEKISKDLFKKGFKYTGPIVIYSHLQACGIINDHDKNCHCYKEICESTEVIHKRRYLEKNVVDFSKK